VAIYLLYIKDLLVPTCSGPILATG